MYIIQLYNFKKQDNQSINKEKIKLVQTKTVRRLDTKFKSQESETTFTIYFTNILHKKKIIIRYSDRYIIVLICIFLMKNYVEYIFISLLPYVYLLW